MKTENITLRLSLAVFIAILIHTVIAIALYWLSPTLFEIQEKTIPFQLISSSKSSLSSNASKLSSEENARAAQEYLATLNQSHFTQSSKRDTSKKANHNQDIQKQTQENTPAKNQQRQSEQLFKSSNPSKAISGLQDIFSQRSLATQSSSAKQLSTKDIEQLNEYEILLLNTLNKGALYDAFHEVMQENKREEVTYTITLYLFPNGAIKNASIQQASGIKEIDELAIQAAYQASPYPTPPRDDIQKGYKYHIPMIVKNN